MSSPDWQELERLWQSSSSSEVAQAKDLVARMHRRPWLRKLTIATEVLLLIAGIAAGGVVILRDRPNALLTGATFLVLTLCAGSMTL